MKRHRLTIYIAWGQFVVAVFLVGAGLALWLSTSPSSLLDELGGLPILIVAVTASGVGALVAARIPGNVVGWILVGVGLSAAVALGAAGYGEYALSTESNGLHLQLSAWASSNAGTLGFHLIGVPFLLFYPDGRLPSKRWRWVAVPSMAAVVVSLTAYALIPGPVPDIDPAVQNPFGLPGAIGRAMSNVSEISFTIVILAVLLSTASIVVRYRGSGIERRQQIKWIAYAGSLLVLAIISANVLTSTGVSDWDDDSHVTILVVTVGMATVPLAAGLAVLRYRLYDIDRIINRTLSYGLLTAGLAGTYFAIVVGLQTLLRPLGGGSDLAIVVTTLVVAALFLPARSRIQRAVDRRFNRRAYDAARTIEAFNARLREQADLDRLRDELLAVVDETMQPARTSLWLRDVEVRR